MSDNAKGLVMLFGGLLVIGLSRFAGSSQWVVEIIGGIAAWSGLWGLL